MEDKLFTAKQLSNHYGVSIKTIERWKKAGLPSINVGERFVRYNFADADKWIKSLKGDK